MGDPFEVGAENTDREIYREREGDYYADSIHVTDTGGIGFSVAGSVIVRPLRVWMETMASHESLKAELSQLKAERDRMAEALGPFAKLAGAILPTLPDHYEAHDAYIGVERAKAQAVITYGDLRRARSALNTGETDAAG
jgi:hypothetical protein